MKLSPPIKILVGTATLAFAVIPLIILASFATVFLGATPEPGEGSFPSVFFEYAMPLFFVLACLLNLLQVALVAFYVTHIVLNNTAADVARIVLALGVFFMPYVAMPLYFILYILILSPPTWALKPQPAPLLSS